MSDRINDPVGLQTSVGWKFYPTYGIKTIEFFSIFNLLVFLMLWRLSNKYYSSFSEAIVCRYSSKWVLLTIS